MSQINLLCQSYTGKLKLTGQNLGRVFNFTIGHLDAARLWCYRVKLPNLNLKTWPKQLLGSLSLDIVLLVLSVVMLNVVILSVIVPLQGWSTINKIVSRVTH